LDLGTVMYLLFSILWLHFECTLDGGGQSIIQKCTLDGGGQSIIQKSFLWTYWVTRLESSMLHSP
jgi:hypothetical protein